MHEDRFRDDEPFEGMAADTEADRTGGWTDAEDLVTDPLIRAFRRAGVFTDDEARAVQAHSDNPASTGFWGHPKQATVVVKPVKGYRIEYWLYRRMPWVHRQLTRFRYRMWNAPPF